MDVGPGPIVESPAVETSPEAARQPAWHVLWTRSNCEALVSDQLTAKGFHVFLPTLEVWMRRGAARQRHRVAMFPGYVFLHHALDKWSDVEIRKARGLVMILGDAWDRRAMIGRAASCDQHMLCFDRPAVSEAKRVGILEHGAGLEGPLADVEGILVRAKPGKGLLVVSVDLLHRSVAVEVDCTIARPV